MDWRTLGTTNIFARQSKSVAEESVHINSIEAFWSFTKRRLAKFTSVKQNSELHLKECEWRYNRARPQLLAALKLLVSKNKDLMVQSFVYNEMTSRRVAF